MENPNDFHFSPNQTQHNRGPINAGRNASTLPKTEDTKGPIIEAQAQLPKLKSRNTVKAKALALDLNEHPTKCFLCERIFKSEKALDGHMKRHPNRLWRGRKPPSTYESFDLNKVPMEGNEASFNLGEFRSE